jgi:hypothetical protein
MREIHVDGAVFIPCTSDFPRQSASAGRVPPDCLSGFIVGLLQDFRGWSVCGVFDRIANSKWAAVLNAYTHRSILSLLRSVRSIGRHRRRLPVGRLGGTRCAFCLCPRISNTLKTHWRSHVLASSDCLELGMSDAAALVLDEIAPEDKNRSPRGPR